MKIKSLLVILSISFIISFNLFRQEFYVSSDGELHLARIAAYTQSLRAGHFPVRWAKDLNFSYGYPIFNFIYPLPYMASSFFNILGFNIFNSLKLVFFLSFLLSGIGMYLWLEKKFNPQAALLGASLYMLAPYRLVDLYVRAALGEAFVFIFPAFVLHFWERFNRKNNPSSLFLTALFYALLILSHNALALIFSAFFVFYILLFKNKKNSFFITFLPFIFGLLFSCFFWLPALWESKYTMVRSPMFLKDYQENFINLKQLILPSWGYGVEGTSYQIGIGLIFSLLIFIIRWRKIKQKKLGFFIIFTFIFSVFFMLPSSDFLWRNIGILRDFQIPTRFLSLTIFVIPLAGALVVFNLKKGQKILVWLLILLSLISVLKYSQPEKYLNLGEDFYKNYPQTTTWHQEATPIWVGSGADNYPASFLTSPDKIIFKNILKEQVRHRFEIEAEKESLVVDNTLYFPGWKVLVNGKKQAIQFQDPRFRGLITFKVPGGIHQAEVIFGRSKIRLMAELISLVSLSGVIFLWCFNKKISSSVIKWRKI